MCLAKMADKSLMRLTKLLLTSRYFNKKCVVGTVDFNKEGYCSAVTCPFCGSLPKYNIVWSQGTKQFFNKVIQPPSPNGVNLNQFPKPNFLNSVIVTDASLDQKMSEDLH